MKPSRGIISAGLAGTWVSVCLFPGQVLANPDDPYNLVAGISSTYDDNLFRLTSSTALPPGSRSSRSDMIYTAFAGVHVDKPYAQQRLQFEFIGTRYEYQKNDYLNFTGFNYRASWLWTLTPNLTGEVHADRSQALANYADFNNPSVRNVQTSENRRIAADWRVGGGWHLLGAALETNFRNSTPFMAIGDYLQDAAEAGVRYVTTGDSALGVVQRESRGEYRHRPLDPVNRLDTRYQQHESEVQGRWHLSGQSTLDGRLAWLKRTHEHFPERDFSGTIGELRYLWSPTAKVQITAQAGRDLSAFQEINPSYPSSYFVNKYAGLTPAWQVSEKTSLRLRLEVSDRQYDGAPVPTSTRREDRVKVALFGTTWRPSRSLDINGTLSREWRTSNIDTLGYHDTIAMVSLALKF